MENAAPNLMGLSLIGNKSLEDRGTAFHGVNPADLSTLEPKFYSATKEDIDLAVSLAKDASPLFARQSGHARAKLLRGIAENLAAEGASIIDRAHLETGLPLPRLQGELGRTVGQLKMFADVLEEGSWVDARIDEPDYDRKPAPRPDIRSMLRPVGPVARIWSEQFPTGVFCCGRRYSIRSGSRQPGHREGASCSPGNK